MKCFDQRNLNVEEQKIQIYARNLLPYICAHYQVKTLVFFHPAIPLKNAAPFILYLINHTVTYNTPDYRMHLLWKSIAESSPHYAGCLEDIIF